MTTPKQDKPTVNKGALKIANTIAKVYDTVSKQGNIVTQCVSIVATMYRGNDVPAIDERFIADNVARIQRWTPKSAGPRKSEVRKMVRNYRTIPEALQVFAKRNGGVSWHEAMKLLTQLNKGLTIRQAVTACFATAVAANVPAPKVLAALLTRISNIETRSAKIIAFRQDLSKLCAKHGIS